MELTIKGSRAEIMGMLATFAAAKNVAEECQVALPSMADIDRLAREIAAKAAARVDNPAMPVDAIRPGDGRVEQESARKDTGRVFSEEESPRLLTANEVLALGDGAIVWVEEQPESPSKSSWHFKRNGKWVAIDMDGRVSLGYDRNEDMLPSTIWLRDCMACRAWSSRPTPEQMAATPWEAQDA